MPYLSLTPMLETNNLEATKEFYTSILQFSCDNYSSESGWMSLKNGGISIMFSSPNEHRNIPAPIMSGSLYFNTDNADELWTSLKDKVKVCYPIENFEYGMREFAIFDNNGYLIQFGQEIA
jgi:uncharacterized glyoxalase superfamily protein PhnB